MKYKVYIALVLLSFIFPSKIMDDTNLRIKEIFPDFTDIDSEDYSLLITSPCIDAGIAYLLSGENEIIKPIVDKYNGKILNIHPSLLPKYKGMNTHQRVIEDKESGEPRLSHRIDLSTGMYNGKKIIFKKESKESKEPDKNS